LPCLFSFQGAIPGSPGKKKRGLASAGPLVESLVSRESSSCSHKGDSGPDDARVGSCRRGMNALAGQIGTRRRPQPAFRLWIPTSWFCLWPSLQREHIQFRVKLSRCQVDCGSR
jgi:hypothetical protein